MIGPRRLIVLVAALACVAAPAGAQNSDTATGNASATIVEPIQIVSGTDINFGVIGAGTVTSQVRLTSVLPITRTVIQGNAQLLGGAGYYPALFLVTGAAGQQFSVLVPTGLTAETSGSGGSSLDIVAVNSNLAVTGDPNTFAGEINPLGFKLVSIGGTLEVPTTAGTGRYTGEFSISLLFQ